MYLYIHSLITIRFISIFFMLLYLHMDVFVLHPRRSTFYELSPRPNSWRQSVLTMKWLATKCPRDETPGNEVSPWRNGRRWNGGDETAATKRDVPSWEPRKICTEDGATLLGVCRTRALQAWLSAVKRQRVISTGKGLAQEVIYVHWPVQGVRAWC